MRNTTNCAGNFAAHTTTCSFGKRPTLLHVQVTFTLHGGGRRNFMCTSCVCSGDFASPCNCLDNKTARGLVLPPFLHDALGEASQRVGISAFIAGAGPGFGPRGGAGPGGQGTEISTLKILICQNEKVVNEAQKQEGKVSDFCGWSGAGTPRPPGPAPAEEPFP